MNIDVNELKEAMLDHASIKKAMRVYEKRERKHDSEEVAEQYCEFMCLKIMSDDFSPATAKLSPGGKVDSFWHAHILDTEGYVQFFPSVFPSGTVVHHDAEKSEDSQEEIAARQERTKEVYRSIFNEECPFFDEVAAEPDPVQEVVVLLNPFTVSVKHMTGETTTEEISSTNTVLELKHLIQTSKGIPPEQQRLIWAGKEIEDERKIEDCNISHGSTIHLVPKIRGC